MRVGGQRHAPAALPPGKTRCPLYRKMGWPQGWVWTGAENLAPNRDSVWSNAKHGRPSPAQITVKVTYKLQSRYV